MRAANNASRMNSGATNNTVFFMRAYLGGVHAANTHNSTRSRAEATESIDVFVNLLTNFTSVFIESGVNQSTLTEPLVRSIDHSILGATNQLVEIGAPLSRSYHTELSRVQIEIIDTRNTTKIDYTSGIGVSFSINSGSIEGSGNGSLIGTSFMEFSDGNLFPHGLNESMAQIGSTVISVLVTSFMNGTVVGVFDYSRNLKVADLQGTDFTPQCVWYNEPISGNEIGSWSTAGCNTTVLNSTHSECECNHLTSFAVLVSSNGAESASESASPHARALSIVTYIGVAVSLTCIVITIITVLSVEQLRTQLRYQILLNLVTSLGLAFFFFCLLTTPTTQFGCEAVSFGALYFFVASVLWNLIEAYDLYQTFCVVFHDGQSRKPFYMHRFRLFAWGGAIVPPSLAMLIDRANFITTIDTPSGVDPLVCWINMAEPIRWAFLAPVAAVIAINTIIAFMIVSAIRKHVAHKSHNAVLYTAKIVANVAVVTGLTWVFAIMVVVTAEVAFSYLFAICASTQGATVFFFHVYHNELSVRAWKKWSILPSAIYSFRGSKRNKSSRNNVVRARPRRPTAQINSSEEPLRPGDDTLSSASVPSRVHRVPWLKAAVVDSRTSDIDATASADSLPSVSQATIRQDADRTDVTKRRRPVVAQAGIYEDDEDDEGIDHRLRGSPHVSRPRVVENAAHDSVYDYATAVLTNTSTAVEADYDNSETPVFDSRASQGQLTASAKTLRVTKRRPPSHRAIGVSTDAGTDNGNDDPGHGCNPTRIKCKPPSPAMLDEDVIYDIANNLIDGAHTSHPAIGSTRSDDEHMLQSDAGRTVRSKADSLVSTLSNIHFGPQVVGVGLTNSEFGTIPRPSGNYGLGSTAGSFTSDNHGLDSISSRDSMQFTSTHNGTPTVGLATDCASIERNRTVRFDAGAHEDKATTEKSLTHDDENDAFIMHDGLFLVPTSRERKWTLESRTRKLSAESGVQWF
jgi:hypothetical protein